MHVIRCLTIVFAGSVAAVSASGLRAQEERRALGAMPTSAIMQKGLKAIDAFAPRVEATYKGGECEVRTDFPMAPRVMSVDYPSHADIQTSIALWFNESGELFRYVENRGARPKPNPNLDSVQAQMRRIPHTSVQFDFHKNSALAMNTGGEETNRGVMGTVDEFDQSATFRYVRPLIDHIRATCKER